MDRINFHRTWQCQDYSAPFITSHQGSTKIKNSVTTLQQNRERQSRSGLKTGVAS